MDQEFWNCQSSYISYINIHIEKNIDLKTGFLRILFWTFVEVKQTIPSGDYHFVLVDYYSRIFEVSITKLTMSEKITSIRTIEIYCIKCRALNTKMSNCSAISWWEQVTFCWDDVRFVLDQHALLAFDRANSLQQQSVGRHVALPEHIITIPNQPAITT
jgi:hypothetical protein